MISDITCRPFCIKEKNILFLKRLIKKKNKDIDYHKEPSIKAIIITDLHGTAYKYSEEELRTIFTNDYDVCFLLGDNYKEDVLYLLPYMDLNKTYAIYGNHDDASFFPTIPLKNIHGKQIQIKDKIFVGWEGSFKYKEAAIGMSQEESIEFEKTLPDRCDYLISHDGLYQPDNDNIPHKGLQGITNYQKRTGCYILRGHLHDRYKNNREHCFYKIETCRI